MCLTDVFLGNNGSLRNKEISHIRLKLHRQHLMVGLSLSWDLLPDFPFQVESNYFCEVMDCILLHYIVRHSNSLTQAIILFEKSELLCTVRKKS